MTKQTHRRAEAGYSLIEVTIVLAITVVVLVMVMQMMESAVQASLFVESHNDLSIMAQRPLNFIQNDIVQSKAVFSGNTTGLSYQTMIESNLTGTAPASNLMPVLDPANAFAPDAVGGTRYAGTCILLVRQLPPLSITIGGSVGAVTVTAGGNGYTSAPTVTFTGGGGSGVAGSAVVSANKVVSVSITNAGTGYTSAPTITFSGGGGSNATATVALLAFNADRYIFEYFYQIDNTSHRFANSIYVPSPDHYVDLMRARFEVVADYNQLVNDTTALTATQKTNIATGLRGAAAATCQPQTRDQNDPTGFTNCNAMKAWNFNAADTTTAFYTVAADMGLTVLNPAALTVRRVNTLLPELRGGRISGRMDYSIATMFGALRYPLRDAVPTYLDPATAPSHSGFEVKITGRSGHQSVMTRLVMMSFYGMSKFDSENGFLITSIPGTVPGT